MKAFLDGLDVRARAGIAVALALLAGIALWATVRSAVSGPWLLAFAMGIVATGAFQLEGTVWPSKFPWGVQDVIDKWSKRRSVIMKTTMGQIAWKVLRAVAGAVAAWYLCEPLTKPVRIATSFGFGASFGFFGAPAAMWGGLVAIVAASGVASHGLGVDFASPQDRAKFLDLWSAGGMKLSWLWAIGFAATPAFWLGVSACVSTTARSMTDRMDKTKRDAADRKRIEERRKRLEGRRVTASDDIIGAAQKRLEDAQERVRAAARKAGPAGHDNGGGEYSPSGEDVLRKANMEDALSQYAAQVAAILRSERSGVDMESQGRRAFDRVILAMTDDMVTRIRTSDDHGMKDLYAYYERVCEAENGASGGDGALVSTRSERREDEYVEQGDGAGEAPIEETYGSIGVARGTVAAVDDEEEDDDIDVLDAPRPSRGRLMMPDDLLPVAVVRDEVSVGADGAPVGGGLLPVDEEDEVSEVTGGSDGGRGIAGPGGEDYEAEDLVAEDASHGAPVVSSLEGAHDLPVVHEDLHEPDDHSHDEDALLAPVPVAGDEPFEPEEPLDLSGLDAPVEPSHEPEEPVEGDAPAALEEPAHVEQTHEEHVPMTTADDADEAASAFSQDEKRNAAAMILSNQVDRAFVEKYGEAFRSVADAASALSVPEIVFGNVWAGYEAKAAALAGERRVRGLLTGEEQIDDETLQASLSDLVASAPSGWSVDPALAIDVAGEISRRAEARRLEQERIEEQERKDREEQERKDREEQERKDKEERDRLEEEERVRAEEERLRLAREAEEAAEAERARLAELETKRMNVAIKLLAMQHDDDTVAAATELFPDRAALAAALNLDEMIVDAPFERFSVVRDARLRYVELISAIAAEDVNAVEAMVRNPDSFLGYEHPEMSVATARSWAEGIRARERVKGIVETARPDVEKSGVATRKLFLAKRLKLTPDLTTLIDSDLVEAFGVVKTTSEFVQMATRNGILPPGMESTLVSAEARLADIVRRIVVEEKAAEYVRAFLPDAQRVPGKDPWDMLLEIAKGDVAAVETVAEPTAEPEVEPQQVVDETARQEPVEPVRPAVEAAEDHGRIRTNISFDAFKPGPTLEEVQAMDWMNIVASAKASETFDPGKIARRIVLSMSEFMSSPADEIVADGNQIHIPVEGPTGRIGKILAEFVPTRMPVWYLADKQHVVMKSAVDGKIQPIEASRFLSGVDGAVEKPNGHPDTVIATIILSSLISPEGLISFRPLIEGEVAKRGLKDAMLIADMHDNEGIKEFYRRVRDSAVR